MPIWNFNAMNHFVLPQWIKTGSLCIIRPMDVLNLKFLMNIALTMIAIFQSVIVRRIININVFPHIAVIIV